MIVLHLFDNSRVNPSILCANPDSLVMGGGGVSNFDFSFILTKVETREDLNTTISGPLSARQRSAIYMAFRWCVDDGPYMAFRWRADDGPTLKARTLFRGSGPVVLGNPIFL